MAFIKAGALKNAIAKQGGFYSPKGEKLKSALLTQAEIDDWNGVKPTAAPKAAAKVEAVVEDDDLQPMLEAAAEDLEETITTAKSKKKK